MVFDYDEAAQSRLLDVLASSGYVASYLAFCADYPLRPGSDVTRLDMKALHALVGDQCHDVVWNKRWKAWTFDPEPIGNWVWSGALVVQRGNNLEPALSGVMGEKRVGSNLASLALNVGRRMKPPIVMNALPRPVFDGNMENMKRLVADLAEFLRTMKDAIRQANWPDTAPCRS